MVSVGSDSPYTEYCSRHQAKDGGGARWKEERAYDDEIRFVLVDNEPGRGVDGGVVVVL